MLEAHARAKFASSLGMLRTIEKRGPRERSGRKRH